MKRVPPFSYRGLPVYRAFFDYRGYRGCCGTSWTRQIIVIYDRDGLGAATNNRNNPYIGIRPVLAVR
jgi:hypothetical protein